MKNIFAVTLLLCFANINLFAQNSEATKSLLPKYEVKDQALYDNVVALDKRFFDAYNRCELDVHKEMIAEDIEFYHYMGRLSSSKIGLLQAMKDNICDKITSELIPGTNEVYATPGNGAIQMGWHQFYN